MDWTESALAELRRLWLSGLSASAIAKRMGRGLTRNAVIGKVHRLGDLPSRKNLTGSSKATRKSRPEQGKAWRPQTPKQIESRAKALVEVELPPETPDVATRTLATLEPLECKWPIGDPRKPGFGFCGSARLPGSPYCARHHRVAYRTPDPGQSSSSHRTPVPSSIRAKPGAFA